MESITFRPDLFPAGIATFAVRYGTDEAPFETDAFGAISIPPDLQTAVEKRRREFRAGRYCAREAIRRCGRAVEAVGEFHLAIGAERQPCWPDGIVGSITHSAGYAAATVARASEWRGVGVDLERWMDSKREARIGGKIVRDDEWPSLASQSGWTREAVVTTVFSLKESVFKCLYPEVRRYFGFHDAWVERLDPVRCEATIRLTTRLTDGLAAGFELCGRFELRDDVVITAVALAR